MSRDLEVLGTAVARPRTKTSFYSGGNSQAAGFTRPASIRRVAASWGCRRRRPRGRGASCARGPARSTCASYGRDSTGSWTAAIDRTRTWDDAGDCSANWRTRRISGSNTPACRPAVDAGPYGPTDSRRTCVACSSESTCFLKNADVLLISRVSRQLAVWTMNHSRRIIHRGRRQMGDLGGQRCESVDELAFRRLEHSIITVENAA